MCSLSSTYFINKLYSIYINKIINISLYKSQKGAKFSEDLYGGAYVFY